MLPHSPSASHRERGRRAPLPLFLVAAEDERGGGAPWWPAGDSHHQGLPGDGDQPLSGRHGWGDNTDLPPELTRVWERSELNDVDGWVEQCSWGVEDCLISLF